MHSHYHKSPYCGVYTFAESNYFSAVISGKAVRARSTLCKEQSKDSANTEILMGVGVRT